MMTAGAGHGPSLAAEVADLLNDGEFKCPDLSVLQIIQMALREWNATMADAGAPVVVASDQLAEMIALDLVINGVALLDDAGVRVFPSSVIDAALGLIHLRAQADGHFGGGCISQ